MRTLLTVCLSVVALYAHHSFAAEFDATKPVTLTGTVTRLEWANPHAHLYMDVKGDKITSWVFELRSPNVLLREGWTRNTIQPGTVVTVKGFRAKNGSATAVVRDVILSDGRRVLH